MPLTGAHKLKKETRNRAPVKVIFKKELDKRQTKRKKKEKIRDACPIL